VPAAALVNSRPFDGLRAGKPTVIADGHDRANCGTQALIAAITVSAIRGVLKTRDADHAG
jgi:predicted alpha/beta-hydrolase family hydrolase